MSLDGKIAVVTGASRGIGLAVAEKLRASGAHVVRIARSLVAGEEAGRTDIPCDITNSGAVERAAGDILNRIGTPDIVVNNAGSFMLKALSETTANEFRDQIAVNLTGSFLVLHEFLPHMIRKGGGHVVTVGSISDHVAFPGNAAYGASKFGLRGLHEVLARELANTDVRTTLISPGATDTSVWDDLDTAGQDDLLDRSEMLHVEDVADAVLFAVTRPARANIDLIRVSPSSI
ncbi:MAG: SDR family oxidoreductase [Gemmatimonadales bacterium]